MALHSSETHGTGWTLWSSPWRKYFSPEGHATRRRFRVKEAEVMQSVDGEYRVVLSSLTTIPSEMTK